MVSESGVRAQWFKQGLRFGLGFSLLTFLALLSPNAASAQDDGPAAPDGCLGSHNDSSLTITWDQPTEDNAVSFIISTAGTGYYGPYSEVGGVDAPATTFATSEFAPLTVVGSYVVQAVDQAGRTSPRAFCHVQKVPVAPLSCGFQRTGNSVIVIWDGFERDGAAGYVIERSQNGGPFTFRNRADLFTQSVYDNSLAPGSTYAYAIVGVSNEPNRLRSPRTICSPVDIDIPGPNSPVSPTSCAAYLDGRGIPSVEWFSAVDGNAAAFLVSRSYSGLLGPFSEAGRTATTDFRPFEDLAWFDEAPEGFGANLLEYKVQAIGASGQTSRAQICDGMFSHAGGLLPREGSQLCGRERVTIFGTSASETIRGTEGRDVIAAGAGDDRIIGLGGDDIICGGAGNDVIVGGAGDDYIRGDRGDDELFGGLGNDRLVGGAGDDKIRGDLGDDQLRGGNDNDNIAGGQGSDLLYGNRGNDELFGNAGDDRIFGGVGNDLLVGNAGQDTVAGEAGNDTCNAESAQGCG